jgi:hypothetical protein
MSSGFSAYSVDLAKVRAVFGCQDEALLNAIINRRKISAKAVDYLGNESPQEGLRRIIMGEVLSPRSTAVYGYLLRDLAGYYGKELYDPQWCQTRSEYVSQFDDLLKKLKVPKKVFRMEHHLMSRDPVELPEREDFPGIGHMTRDEVAAAATALNALDPEAVLKAATGIATDRGVVDPAFTVACLDELRAWFAACQKDGVDLISFYS